MIFEGIKYVVFKPEDFQENLEYPTVIFMHGAGTRGDTYLWWRNVLECGQIKRLEYLGISWEERYGCVVRRKR